MNLQKLFETQRELDKQIVEKHNLHGKDLLDKKILALQVELGELANEWRGFKFWSNDQKPRTREYLTNYTEQDSFLGPGAVWKNPLLEEYVDCLHFILSIGNDKKYNIYEYEPLKGRPQKVISCFRMMFNAIVDINHVNTVSNYNFLMGTFLRLGEMLGFTWEQIEQAYYDKNKINHARQEQGY